MGRDLRCPYLLTLCPIHKNASTFFVQRNDGAGGICRVWRSAKVVGVMSDSIRAELIEIEAMLEDDRLSEADRFALYGASQALRHILDPDVWQTASQTFYRLDARPSDPPSKAQH